MKTIALAVLLNLIFLAGYSQPTIIYDELEFVDDCYFDANVGIGTINPAAPLDVVGNTRVTTGTKRMILTTNLFVVEDTVRADGIFWQDSSGNFNSKIFGHINGFNYNSLVASDLSLEVGQRTIGGAHTATIQFHTDTSTGVGEIHLDVQNAALQEIQLHVAADDSSIDLTTTGDEINITAADSLNFQAVIIENTGQVYNVGTGTFITNKATSEGRLFFVEDTDNGTNTVRLGSPASLAASYNLTLPPNDGDVADLLRTNGTGTLTWVPPTWIDISSSRVDSIISWTTYDSESIIIEKDYEDYKIRTNDNSEGILIGNANQAQLYADIQNQTAQLLAGTEENVTLSGGSKYFSVTTNNAIRFVIDSNGIIYGTAIHNNAAANGGTTQQDIRSGTYTPTLTNVTNIAASTAFQCQWLRVGNTVTVSGKVGIDVTLGIASELGMSLPVASDIGAEENAGGTASSPAAASLVSAIKGDAANNRAAFVFVAVSLTNDSYFFEFSYLVL